MRGESESGNSPTSFPLRLRTVNRALNSLETHQIGATSRAFVFGRRRTGRLDPAPPAPALPEIRGVKSGKIDSVSGVRYSSHFRWRSVPYVAVFD